MPASPASSTAPEGVATDVSRPPFDSDPDEPDQLSEPVELVRSPDERMLRRLLGGHTQHHRG